MASLLVIVFLVEVTARLIDAVGATTLNDILWTGINYLPVPTSKAAAEQRKLQAEYLKVRREMNATSSQDEFAKWARLRRQHDKLLEQLDAAKKGLEASRTRFNKSLNGIRVLLTKAPQYIVPFWYSKVPMFWLPHGWFPYYAEWIISFPRAPLGSVSIQSWQLACAGFAVLLSDVLTLLWKLVFGSGEQKEAPVKAGEGKSSSAKTAKVEKKTS